MFDGINAVYKVPCNNGNILTFDCWEVLINEATGQRVNDIKTGIFRGLNIALKPSFDGSYYNFIVKGSIHKWHNEGLHNSDQFTHENVQIAVATLCDIFGISATETKLHGLEIGVNICMDCPINTILKNAVCFKNKPFTSINKQGKSKGIVCTLTNYEVKLYDKQAQSKMDIGNVLRLEIKVNEMRFLNGYGFATLADLADPCKAIKAIELLESIVKNIVWIDTSTDLNKMTNREQKQWLRMANYTSWKCGKSTRYKLGKMYQKLAKKYANIDTEKHLLECLKSTWLQLFTAETQPENRRPFRQQLEDFAAVEKATFSPLECTPKKSPLLTDNLEPNNCDLSIKENDNYKNVRKMTKHKNLGAKCTTCKKDISAQKKGSRFCGEKLAGYTAARHCRNKDSGQRRNFKNKINKAMIQNNFIAVTYTDGNGSTFTDTLHPTELKGISRLWFDRVQSIIILPVGKNDSPENMQGCKAKEYLNNLNKN